MFSIASSPDLYQKLPTLTIEGCGKIYYINKYDSPYLAIEIAPQTWNPFNTECFFHHYFCIGNGKEVYFVNLYTQEMNVLSCDMYFGYFYKNKNKLYVASNSQLFCFSSNCQLLWESEKIAIDGVIVNEFLSDCIIVSCEIDPPNHWIEYQLSIYTGAVLY